MAQAATAKQVAFLEGKGYNTENIDFDEAKAIIDFWASHNWNPPNGLECPAYNPEGRSVPQATAPPANRRPAAAPAAANQYAGTNGSGPTNRRPAAQGAPARQPAAAGGAPQPQRNPNGPATERQVKLLAEKGYDVTGITFGEASQLIDELKANNWQVPVAAANTEDAPFGP